MSETRCWDVNTKKTFLPSQSGSGALVSLTPLAGVIFFQQCRAEVADVLGEEAGVLHARLWWRVQAVGPVAVIQVLSIHRDNNKIIRCSCFYLSIFLSSGGWDGGGNLVEFLIQVYTAKKKKVEEWCQNLLLCVGLCNRVLPNCQPCALAYVCIVAFDCQKQEWPTHPELWVWLSQKRKKQKNVKVFKPKIKNWVVFFFLTSLSVERSRCVPKPRASGCYRRVNRATRGIDWEQLSGTHTGNILNTFLSNKMSWNSSEEQKKTDFNAWGYRLPSCSNGELQ